ncbi:MAG: twin-arginine translocation signal domain-containing protein, partial [Myxococcota bacterium]
MPELDRRTFLKIAGASAGAAAASGCSDPVEKLIPYVVQPEEITPGNPVWYASTCQECAVGCGLHVKTRENRPIKVEGNPDHPINQGKLCAKAQAGVNQVYDPDRVLYPLRRVGARGEGKWKRVTWDEALDELA